MMIDGKKVFLKVWLVLIGGKFSELQVEYEVNGFVIRW